MENKITMGADGRLHVPERPVIPFIIGDGIGPDIWRAAVRVFDRAIEKCYNGSKKIIWKEVLAGEKAYNERGSWLPDETLQSFREYLVGIKGPLTTPIGGGIRSLNVALRKELDLYVYGQPNGTMVCHLLSGAPNWWIWLCSAKIRKTSTPVSNLLPERPNPARSKTS